MYIPGLGMVDIINNFDLPRVIDRFFLSFFSVILFGIPLYGLLYLKPHRQLYYIQHKYT